MLSLPNNKMLTPNKIYHKIKETYQRLVNYAEERNYSGEEIVNNGISSALVAVSAAGTLYVHNRIKDAHIDLGREIPNKYIPVFTEIAKKSVESEKLVNRYVNYNDKYLGEAGVKAGETQTEIILHHSKLT